MSRRDRDIGTHEGIPPGVLALGQPDVPDQVFRALQLKGALPGELDRRIQLGMNVEDFTRPEFLWLRRGSYGYGGVNQNALAANFGWATITGGVGRVATVELIQIVNRNAVAAEFQVGWVNGAPSAGGVAFPGVNRDDRGGTGATLGAILQGARNAAIANPPINPILISVPAGGSYDLDQPWMLTGAAILAVVGFVVNSTVCVNFFWRERTQLTSEI